MNSSFECAPRNEHRKHHMMQMRTYAQRRDTSQGNIRSQNKVQNIKNFRHGHPKRSSHKFARARVKACQNYNIYGGRLLCLSPPPLCHASSLHFLCKFSSRLVALVLYAPILITFLYSQPLQRTLFLLTMKVEAKTNFLLTEMYFRNSQRQTL